MAKPKPTRKKDRIELQSEFFWFLEQWLDRLHKSGISLRDEPEPRIDTDSIFENLEITHKQPLPLTPRNVIAQVLSECLATRLYIVDVLANPEKKDAAHERELIKRWYSISTQIVLLETRLDGLKVLGRDLRDWANSWVKPEPWSCLDNEEALLKTRNISEKAERLLEMLDRSSANRAWLDTQVTVRDDSFGKEDSSIQEIDVFLAHNHQDTTAVTNIAAALRVRGISPWLDSEQIAPGRWFQEVIEQAVLRVKAAAIFIGPSGLGRWQALEVCSFVTRCIESRLPVIPVLLPGAPEIPSQLLFLRELHSVRFTVIDDQQALDQLQWGITGIKPS